MRISLKTLWILSLTCKDEVASNFMGHVTQKPVYWKNGQFVFA